jgi:anti-sigma factor RsiW
MNHQPFENWILDENQLSTVQKHEFLEHLEKCPKCAGLEKSWKAARHEVKSMPVVNAPAGFSKRFSASLVNRRKAYEHHQAQVLLISLVSSGIAILITLGVFLLPHTSILSMLISLIAGTLQIVNLITQLWIFLTSLLKAAPTSFLISVGVMVSLFVSMLSVIWAFSFYRITTKGMQIVHEN